jgi:hypothetical protein
MNAGADDPRPPDLCMKWPAAPRFSTSSGRPIVKPRLPALLLVLSACAPSAGGNGTSGMDRDTSHAITVSQPPHLPGNNPTPGNAPQATLAAFTRYDVVGLGILSYANQDFDDFILDLIRDPAFPDKVNDIAVECGNSLYQPVLDRYIGGEDVPLSEVQQVWRNTTQPMCGVSGFYEQLFPLVRRINQRLPLGRRLRVLACDPPVDWSTVMKREDLRPFMDRDAGIAAVMEREVLAKHRKALMIFGLRHLMHGGGGAVRMYEGRGYPHTTLVIMAHNGFGNNTPLSARNDELEGRMAAWQVPSLVTLHGTWLDDLDRAYFVPGEGRGNRISRAVDAYLYLGPRDLLLKEPIPARLVLDTAYLAELRRRAQLRQGPMGPDAMLHEASDTDVFFNQSACTAADLGDDLVASCAAALHLKRESVRPPE